MLEEAASTTLFPCKNRVRVLKEIPLVSQKFQGGERFILFQIGLFS
jgi:hypothetical protein